MNTIKIKLLLAMGFIAFASVLQSQTLDDFGKITLKSQIQNRASLTQDAITLLETRMSQMVTTNGIGSTDVNPRFVISATINMLNKDIVAGPPQMVSQNLEVTFTIGDVSEKKAFATVSTTLIGVGKNENKAFIEAIKKINPNNPTYKSFINEAKTKIINYYQTNCEAILKDATNLSSQGKYNQAIYNLSLIPDVCSECYQKSLDLQADLYVKKIESEGLKLFQQAKSTWSQAPNKEGVAKVTRLISQISPDVSFIGEVNAFIDEVSAIIQVQQQQEWEQQIREWEQSVREWEQAAKEREQAHKDRVEQEKVQSARNHELNKMQTQQNYTLEQDRIRACREIAVEYARNQPKEVYNNNYIVW